MTVWVGLLAHRCFGRIGYWFFRDFSVGGDAHNVILEPTCMCTLHDHSHHARSGDIYSRLLLLYVPSSFLLPPIFRAMTLAASPVVCLSFTNSVFSLVVNTPPNILFAHPLLPLPPIMVIIIIISWWRYNAGLTGACLYRWLNLEKVYTYVTSELERTVMCKISNVNTMEVYVMWSVRVVVLLLTVANGLTYESEPPPPSPTRYTRHNCSHHGRWVWLSCLQPGCRPSGRCTSHSAGGGRHGRMGAGVRPACSYRIQTAGAREVVLRRSGAKWLTGRPRCKAFYYHGGWVLATSLEGLVMYIYLSIYICIYMYVYIQKAVSWRREILGGTAMKKSKYVHLPCVALAELIMFFILMVLSVGWFCGVPVWHLHTYYCNIFLSHFVHRHN